jgi:hypothetical protein
VDAFRSSIAATDFTQIEFLLPNSVYTGRCQDLLRRAQPGSWNCAFVDPNFNIGSHRLYGNSAKSFGSDSRPEIDYICGLILLFLLLDRALCAGAVVALMLGEKVGTFYLPARVCELIRLFTPWEMQSYFDWDKRNAQPSPKAPQPGRPIQRIFILGRKGCALRPNVKCIEKKSTSSQQVRFFSSNCVCASHLASFLHLLCWFNLASPLTQLLCRRHSTAAVAARGSASCSVTGSLSPLAICLPACIP